MPRPSETLDLFVFSMAGLHVVVIAVCIILSALYLRRTKLMADIARLWTVSLFVVLLMNVRRYFLRAPSFGEAWDAAILLSFSNVANLFILEIARRVWAEKGYRPRFGPWLLALIGILVAGPILTQLLWPADVDAANRATWLFRLRAPVSLFSAASLLVLGSALGSYLISAKNIIAATFWIYAVYQIPYGFLLPWIPQGTSEAVLANMLYVVGVLLLKASCTWALVVAASEYGRLQEIEVLRALDSTDDSRLTLASKFTLSPVLANRVQLLCGAGTEADCRSAEDYLRKWGLVVDRVDETGLVDQNLADILNRMATAKYCVALLGTTAGAEIRGVLDNMLLQRKSYLILRRDDASPHHVEGNVVRFYRSSGQMEGLLTHWLRENVLTPFRSFEVGVTRPKKAKIA